MLVFFSAVNLIHKVTISFVLFLFAGITSVFAGSPHVHYTVSMEKPASHVFSVAITFDGFLGIFENNQA
jgi:hypothetical protein